MNNASTVDLFDEGPILQATTSSPWCESHERQSKKAFDLFRMTKVARLALFLAVSPVTAIPDLWLMEKKRRDAVVTMSIYQEVIGRFISRSEALRIARQILVSAEQERIQLAEWEAERGIQWEEGE